MANSKSGLPQSIANHAKAGDARQGSSLVVCFGEMLIDFVPTVAGVSLAEAPAFKKAPGGAPTNVAVGISRLGGSSAFIAKENPITPSSYPEEDNSRQQFDPAVRTALAFITLRADGEREFMFFRNPSADMLLRESELNVALIKKGSIFHFGSISLIEEPCRSTHLAAMDIAKKSGNILSYDPNLSLPLWPSADAARQGIMSIWNEADIIKISEEEISFLTGGDDPYDDKSFSGRVAGVKVKAVDTTGAGDAFVSGILSSLASDLNLYQDEKRLREALLFANSCGVITVTERGAIPALPTKDAVLQMLPEATT